MSMQPRAPFAPLIPENAPFSPEQRSWLNGFFAGLFSLDGAPVPLSPADGAALMPATPAASPAADPLADGDDGEAPWHDPAMPLAERMTLAEGRPLRRRMMAAMAQQDCGQCGYTCEAYSDALVLRTEERLNLCVPGGKETARNLKALAEELTGSEAGSAGSDTGAPTVAKDPTGAPALAAPAVPNGASPSAAPTATRDKPGLATFLSRRRLNAAGSEKETHHVEFDLSASGLAYRAGDSFGVFAENAPSLARAVIRLIGLPPSEPISAGGQTRTLFDWLAHQKALGAAPDALFLALAREAGDIHERKRLERMSEGEEADGDLASLDVLAALQKYRHLAPSPARLIEALDPLQPRLYSISSTPRANPGRVSLTVDTVRYTLADRLRMGVASTWLADRAEPGDRVRAYVQPAHGFELPDNDDTPIVMVGPGTGVAPFRAFLQERMARGAKGGAWLFYGHQREAQDFFYREELEGFAASGTLSRLSTAWSRDGARKVYVQDRMREAGADLHGWIEQGAHLYVCGDAKRMAKDVDAALVAIVAEHGGMPGEEARARVDALKCAGRYQADVY
jgi:sulfite reductase (NADPH) flavoprotein alpha-component